MFVFKGTNEISYLYELIILCYDILKLILVGERMHFNANRVLVSSLLARLSLRNRIQ